MLAESRTPVSRISPCYKVIHHTVTVVMYYLFVFSAEIVSNVKWSLHMQSKRITWTPFQCRGQITYCSQIFILNMSFMSSTVTGPGFTRGGTAMKKERRPSLWPISPKSIGPKKWAFILDTPPPLGSRNILLFNSLC